MLYTGSDLVADIGGYLGLFLGLSAFGIVQILEQMIKSNLETTNKSPSSDNQLKRTQRGTNKTPETDVPEKI